MKKLVILARAPFNTRERTFSIGGIQTYLKNLAEIARDAGYAVTLCENNRFDSEDGQMEHEGIIVRYRPYPRKGDNSFYFQNAFDYWYELLNDEDTVFVVETDQQSYKSSAKNVIQIQHGIAFDIPREFIAGVWGKYSWLSRVQKTLRCLRNTKRLHQVKNTVCVDYNFYNWFRTLDSIRPDEHVVVIPNFSSGRISADALECKLSRLGTEGNLKIVVARRFVEHRGVLMFANVVKRLLAEGYAIDVTFAGEGPCLPQLQAMFAGSDAVHFTSYTSEQSVEFHREFDVAVVPTIFSEGTSLSLSEAMSAGCVPVATYVGGMSNMILDGFNGFMSYPSESELYSTLRRVVTMSPKGLATVARNAYDSATMAFGREEWAAKWLAFLETVLIART